MRLTIAVPYSYIEIANNFAMALGYSESDGETYHNPSWQDAQGTLYAVASLPVSAGFVGAATTPLQRPDWDTGNVIDMAMAAQAQALVLLWMPNEDDPHPPQANPAQIVAILGLDGQAAIEAMGLTAVEQDAAAEAYYTARVV